MSISSVYGGCVPGAGLASAVCVKLMFCGIEISIAADDSLQNDGVFRRGSICLFDSAGADVTARYAEGGDISDAEGLYVAMTR